MTGWPEPDALGRHDTARTEYWKEVACALVEIEKQRRLDKLAIAKKAADDQAEIKKSEYLADLEIQKEAVKARLEVAKAGVERARDNAKFVQLASAGLGTAYTGVATLAFSATGTQLPTRGFIPTIFFGVAVVLATAFLAFIIKPDETTDLDPSGLPRLNSQRKADSFVLWVRSDILTKAPLLRGAAVALLFGVLFLPVAMVTGAPTAAAEGGEATASAEPSWPPFPEATPLELAAVLYSAQLEAYREDLDAAAASTSTAAEPDSIESTAWSLAVIGLGVVLLVTLPFWARFAMGRPDANDRPKPGPMRDV